LNSQYLTDLGATFERAGLWQRAGEVYDLVLATEADHAGAIAGRVRAACQQGDIDTALRLGVDRPGQRQLVAQALVAAGRAPAAAALLREAIAVEPDLGLFTTLIETEMPGPAYYQHLAWLHETLRPATYLEIGVWYGQSLCLAKPPTVALGVDPKPWHELPAFAAETRIFTITSDAFFADQPWHAALGPRRFDLAFIDGLHRFEQVLRDFVNVERHCTPDSVVVFHDTLPLVPVAAEREVAAPFWCGDVWKIVPCLEHYRPDLRIVTIPTAPSGLTIVTGLDPASAVLADRFDEAAARFASAPYAMVEARLPQGRSAACNRYETLIEAIGRLS
jgi:hypothetical protein